MRWSQAALDKRVKSGVRISSEFGAGTASRAATARQGTGSEKPARASGSDQVQQVISSIRSATCTGSHRRGEFMELFFRGARTMGSNALMGLSHFQRIPVRDAWHEAVRWGVLELTKGPRHFDILKTYEIEATRYSPSMVDTDAIDSHLKYPIDGMRYAGVIIDDNPKWFRRLISHQEIGEYGLRIVVRAVAPVD